MCLAVLRHNKKACALLKKFYVFGFFNSIIGRYKVRKEPSPAKRCEKMRKERKRCEKSRFMEEKNRLCYIELDFDRTGVIKNQSAVIPSLKKNLFLYSSACFLMKLGSFRIFSALFASFRIFSSVTALFALYTHPAISVVVDLQNRSASGQNGCFN